MQIAVFCKGMYSYMSQFTTTWWLPSCIAINFKAHPDVKKIKIRKNPKTLEFITF